MSAAPLLKKILKPLEQGRLYIKLLRMVVQKLRIPEYYIALKNLYNHDALTGLYNRVACNEMVIPMFAELEAQNVYHTSLRLLLIKHPRHSL